MPLKVFQRKPKQMAYKEPERINVSLGRKYNVGNYESVDLHVSFSRDLEAGETVEHCYESIFNSVREELNREAGSLGIKTKV